MENKPSSSLQPIVKQPHLYSKQQYSDCELSEFSLHRGVVVEYSETSCGSVVACSHCNIQFDSLKSLQVHVQYHHSGGHSGQLELVSGNSSAREVGGVVISKTSNIPKFLISSTSMQMSMAQSMGIHQGAPPHLSGHHHTSCPPTTTTTASILDCPEPPGLPSPTDLPSLASDVTDFFSQLDNPSALSDNVQTLSVNSFLSSGGSAEIKTSSTTHNRFHPYEGRLTACSSNGMNQTVSMGSQGYGSSYGVTFNDAQQQVYTGQGTGDYLAGFTVSDIQTTHDHSGEDIWDLDSNTVRRYNPVPDTVSPGPIPTTPTMYSNSQVQQTHQQLHNKQQQASWESNISGYSQYGTGGGTRGQTPLPQTMPSQSVSPGIGGPWIGGSLPIKTQSSVDAKRPKSYQCEACDKWFTSSGHLKRHFNTTLHKNAIKQKGGGEGYLDGMNGGGTFSIPSVESRGAPSPCLSLGEESSQSSVCEELSSQSAQSSSHLSLTGTPVTTPVPVNSINQLNHIPTSQPPDSSPHSNTSSNNNVPNPSPHILLLSPPNSSSGGMEPASSPLNGLTQMVGINNPSTPQPPSISPLTPGSGMSLSPNNTNNMNGSPIQKNRYSPFRGGLPSTTTTNLSYKVQSVDQQPRNYPSSSYPSTFQSVSTTSTLHHNFNNGDVYMTPSPASSQSSFRSGEGYSTGSGSSYSGQYHAQYQPIVYNPGYDMTSHSGYISHPTYTDISGYLPMGTEGIHVFSENSSRTVKEERDSPEGSESSDMSLKNENGEFRCNECNKVFNKICYLKQHNKSFHNGEKPFKCTQCGKRFPVEVLYQEHLAKHAGDKPYKCEVCPKQFNHKTDLRRHMCLHTGEKPFTCDVCGKGFIREDRMVKHADTHKKKAAHVAGGLM